MTRTTIRADAGGDVVVTAHDAPRHAGRELHRFSTRASNDGRIERVVTEAYRGEWRDARKGLRDKGEILRIHPGDPLVDLIRREWRRARAAERREAKRYGWRATR